MSDRTKYNYVLFDSSGSYFRIARSDLESYPYCIVREDDKLPQAGGFEQLLFKIHTSRHFSSRNRVVPFQNIWNKAQIGKLTFSENKPICFLFATALSKYYDMRFFEYLRKSYPNCKIVLMLRDVVQVCLNRSGGRTIKDLFSTFDRIYTINKKDAEEYGFEKINVMCSKYQIEGPTDYSSDIVFVGKMKDRYDTINQIYERLTSTGVNCDFTLLTDGNDKKNIEGIKIISKPMSYEEMLKKTMGSRCILEVTQKGIDSVSSRYLEALCYNKKLITDVRSIETTKYYNPKFMLIYNTIEDIDPAFIKDTVEVDYEYDDYYSPVNLLKFIDGDLA